MLAPRAGLLSCAAAPCPAILRLHEDEVPIACVS